MVFKASVLFMLLLVVAFACQEPTTSSVEARPVPLLSQERDSKIFSTLGVVCKCCDGAGGGEEECTSSPWHGTCSDIRCLPWKFRS